MLTPIVSPLANQLSAQQVPPQIAHQLGPSMGGGMGSQLPPGMPGSQYGPPSASQFPQQRASRAVKIVDPNTHQEVRVDKSKKGDSFMDSGPSTSGPGSAGLAGRVSSNGPQPRPPVGFNPAHHQMVPSGMAYYNPYHPPPSFFQQGPPKAGVPSTGGPPTNTPGVRFFAPPLPGQVPFGGHPGAAPTPSGSKVPHLGSMPQLGTVNPGPSPVEVLGTQPVSPIMINPLVGPAAATVPGIPAVIASARPVPGPLPQLGLNHTLSANGTPAGLVMPPASPPAPITPSSVLPSPNSVMAFKFGDVEASGSAPVTSEEAAVEGPSVPSSSANGHVATVTESVSSTGSLPNAAVIGSLPIPVTSAPLTITRPNVTVVPPKQVTSASAVSPKVVTPSGTGGAGTLGEKVKGESAKASGNQNPRKNNKKEKQQQRQQQHVQPLLPVLQVSEGQGDKNLDKIVSAAAQAPAEKHTASLPGGYRSGLQRTQSGAHNSPAVYAPVKTTSNKFEESKSIEKKSGGKLSSQGKTCAQCLVTSAYSWSPFIVSEDFPCFHNHSHFCMLRCRFASSSSRGGHRIDSL